MFKVSRTRVLVEMSVVTILLTLICLLIAWGRDPSGTYVDAYLGVQRDAYWKLTDGKAFLIAGGRKEFLGYYSYSPAAHSWVIRKEPSQEPNGLLFPSVLHLAICDTNRTVLVLPRCGFAWTYKNW